MLSDESGGPMLDFRDELSRQGQLFTNAHNLPGALFIYVLYKLTEHIVVQEAIDRLEAGLYLCRMSKLFRKSLYPCC